VLIIALFISGNLNILKTEKTNGWKAMRFSMLTFLLTLRLMVGRLINPEIISLNHPKFFPTPRKAVYKKGLLRYFFMN